MHHIIICSTHVPLTTNTQEKDYCKSTLPAVFRDIEKSGSKCVRRPMPPPLPAGELGFCPCLVPGTGTGLSAPLGYPTLKSMQVSFWG